MDGFVFEYNHFRDYCKDTDPVTVSEINEIKNYCKKKYITLVPNQNSFGHMEKWLEKEELKDLAIQREDKRRADTLNPLDKRSLELIDTIFSDLLPHFESETVNIGMDETTSIGMGQTKEECSKRGVESVYVEYLNKVVSLANDKYKKTAMCWDDIIFKYPNIFEKMNKECILMDWGYETESPFMQRCTKLKEMGIRFYVCPGTSSWGSLTGRFTNMIYNIESAANACIKNSGEGFLLTDWGDSGNPQFLPASVLPYIFGACCSWSYKLPSRETTYDKQVRVVKYCEDYADRFIFKAKGISKILHRLANYYVLENQERFNGTYLWRESDIYCKKVKTDDEILVLCMEPENMSDIINYALNLKKQLYTYDLNTPYIREIICNCNMVILFAEFVKASIEAGENKISNNKLKTDLIKMKDDFKELWCIKNRPVGYDIFISRLNQMINKFE